MPYEFSKAETKRISKLYTQGTGLVALAEEYGVSTPVIRRVLVETNTKIRGRGRPRVNA